MTTVDPLPQIAILDNEQKLRQAVDFHQAGWQEEAVALYQSILQADPRHAEANNNMGVMAVQVNQPAAGLSYFMAALDADPSRARYWLGYIDALLQADQLETARDVLALARQHGLQGGEVDALARRLESATLVAEEPPAVNPRTSKESSPAPSAAPKSNKGKPEAQPVTPDKSARRPTSHKGKSPSPKEIDTLVQIFSRGRFAEAATLFRSMTVRFPLHAFGWKALGATLKQMGENAEALGPMQRAATLSPGDAEVHNNLGSVLHDLGRLEEAEANYRRALRISPNSANTHYNYGVTLTDQGRLEEAEASYRRAIEINPDSADAHRNLGGILHTFSRFDEAETEFRRALEIKPDFAEALSNLGITLKDLGRKDEAELSCRQSIQINPECGDAHGNLGVILHDLGRLADAEASYQRAIRIKPDIAETHCNLGAVLHNLERLDEAEASYMRALEIKPNLAEAHLDLGNTLKNLGRLGEAKASYSKAAQLGLSGARTKEALVLPAIIGTRHEMMESRAMFEQGLDKLVADGVALADPLNHIGETNFYLAYHGLNDKDLQVKVAKYYEQACPSLLFTAPHCIGPKADTRERTRVGFFSKFLYSHSVSLCFSKIIETLSRKEQFEVSLISNHSIDENIYSEFAGRRVNVPYNLNLAREAIAALELDVLVYLDIGMEPLSYFLAFSRLARTQCVLGGHPVTTGIANVDYFLSADDQEPLGADEHYSEKLVRLPRVLVYFERPAMPEKLKTRHELNLPTGRHIYMCPMRLQKLHPDFDEAIARILQLDDNGVVVLFEDNLRAWWKKALLKRFESTIPAEFWQRIIFLPWLKDPTDFISAIAAADVVLDPFHFGIGSTVVMTSITGTPLVTRAGEFMRGRIGAYYCEVLDSAECITQSTEGYAQRAVEIASDQLVREKIRAKILKKNPVLYEDLRPIEDLVSFINSLSGSWHSV